MAETGTSGSVLRVQATSKFAFGATTVALVGLASGGTAVLVNSGTGMSTSATSLPHGSLLLDGTPSAAIVVPGAAPRPHPDRSAAAIAAALAQRPKTGRRTLTAPLVALPAQPRTPRPGTAQRPVVAPTVPRRTPPPVAPTVAPTVTPSAPAAPVAAPVVAPDGGFHKPRTPHSPLPGATGSPTPTTAPAAAPPAALPPRPVVWPVSEPVSVPVVAPVVVALPSVIDLRDDSDKAHDKAHDKAPKKTHGKAHEADSRAADRSKHARRGRHSR